MSVVESIDSGGRIPVIMRAIIAVAVAVAVLILLPFSMDTGRDAKYLAIHVAAFALAALWLFQAVKGDGPRIRLSLPGLLLALYLALNLAAALASEHVANSLNEWRRYFVLALMFYLSGALFRSPSQIRRMLIVACAAVTLSSVYGLFQKIGMDPFPWIDRTVAEYRELPATFGNPNIATHTLNLALILLVALAADAFRYGRRGWMSGAPYLVMAGIVATHLYFTGVRAAYLALVGASALLLISAAAGRARCTSTKKIRVVLVSLAVLGAAGVAAGAGYTKLRTGFYLPLDRSILLRYHAYYGASGMIADRPLLGYGPGNYHIDNPPYWTHYERERFAVKLMKNLNVHNEYLEAAVEAGFVSCALYLGFLIAAIAYGLRLYFADTDRRRRWKGLALACGLCAFAVDGFFGFNFRVPVSALFLFVLAGCIDGLSAPAGRAEQGRLARIGLPCAVFVSVSMFLGWETLAYASSCLMLRAKGALEYRLTEPARAALLLGERLAPWDYRFPRDLGILEMSEYRRRYDRAIEHLARAIELNPNDVRLHAFQGLAHLNLAALAVEGQATERQTHFEEAKKCAERAAALCPNLPQVHELYGRLEVMAATGAISGVPSRPEQEAAYRRAADHFWNALRYATDQPAQTNMMLAQTYAALGENAAAEAAWTRAVDCAPGRMDAWRQFCAFADMRGAWPALCTALSAQIARIRKTPQSDKELAASLAIMWVQILAEKTGEPVGARKAARDAVAFDPSRLELWACYTGLYPPGERLPAAIELHRALQAHIPGEEILSALARGTPEGCIAAAAELRKVCRRVLEQQGKEVLRRQYRWLCDLVADALADKDGQPYGEALHAAGFVYLIMDGWAEAEPLLRRAVAAIDEKQQPQCLVHLSESLLQLGRFEAAYTAARDAYEREPFLLPVLIQYAKTLAKSGRSQEAEIEYNRLTHMPGLDQATRSRIKAELDAVFAPGGTQ